VGPASVICNGALDRIRTCGLLLRRQTLYPLGYEGVWASNAAHELYHNPSDRATCRRSTMAPVKMLLIVNPAARHGKTEHIIPALRRMFQGLERLDILLSSGPRHAQDIAARASGYDTIVAVGGDGTVHEVANGILSNPARPLPTFGVIPTGSGNDYARTLGMSDDLAVAVGQIMTSASRPLDFGLCNHVWFAESMSIGLDARVTAKANLLKGSSRLTGLPLYLRALFVRVAPRVPRASSHDHL
jgi:diacylglycerol kinase family enzyme